MKKKILWILFAIVLCSNVLSCSKESKEIAAEAEENNYNKFVYSFYLMQRCYGDDVYSALVKMRTHGFYVEEGYEQGLYFYKLKKSIIKID